jgi:hypothetical protein
LTPRLTICDRCSTLLEVGDWPFCPHGPGRVTVISDSIPGGQLIENLGPEPVRVYSETERQRIMKERGLVDAVRHRDGSKLTSNWAGGATAKMLEDATELVSRPARRTRADELDADVPVTITVTERGSFSVPPDGEPHAD